MLISSFTLIHNVIQIHTFCVMWCNSVVVQITNCYFNMVVLSTWIKFNEQKKLIMVIVWIPKKDWLVFFTTKFCSKVSLLTNICKCDVSCGLVAALPFIFNPAPDGIKDLWPQGVKFCLIKICLPNIQQELFAQKKYQVQQ